MKVVDARSRQPSFFDTDQICQPLFPPDSFWHQFQELVYPLINDEDYSCMYCPDRGRPAKVACDSLSAKGRTAIKAVPTQAKEHDRARGAIAFDL